MEKSNILEKVKNAIARIESSAEIILYGSRARDDYHEGSDWDFLVLLDGNVDYARSDRVRHQLHEIEWDTGEILCAIVRSRDEWANPKYQAMPLFQNIKLEGIRI